MAETSFDFIQVLGSAECSGGVCASIIWCSNVYMVLGVDLECGAEGGEVSGKVALCIKSNIGSM